jgi:hypothetical protein
LYTIYRHDELLNLTCHVTPHLLFDEWLRHDMERLATGLLLNDIANTKTRLSCALCRLL